jgi:hypothetical protein
LQQVITRDQQAAFNALVHSSQKSSDARTENI